MALDYIIGGLQLLSAAVNVLALGAFWISPGLRATANRFVINLLVANIVACCALTPALWLHGGLKTSFHMDNGVASTTVETIYQSSPSSSSNLQFQTQNADQLVIGDITVNPLHHQHQQRKQQPYSHHRANRYERDVEQQPDTVHPNQQMQDNEIEKSIESVVIERDERGNVRKITEQQVVDIQNANGDDDVVEIVEEFDAEPAAMVGSQRTLSVESIAAIKQKSSTAQHHRAYAVFSENALIFDCTRFWGFDFAATIGVLSVVLVVGDTWCAVTDPLRYHSRISYLKSWLLIASVWLVSIAVTIISAFRSKWCHIEWDTTDNLFTDEKHDSTTMTTTATINGTHDTMFVANIYALVFSCVFFFVIVLVPIAVVCLMYYKIYSEARQSGLRMRRNGSSPLLQSSLNLQNTGVNTVAEHQRYPSLFDVSAADAITMKIDALEDGKSPIADYGKALPIGTHQYRRYLDIPEVEKQQSIEEPVGKRRRTISERGLGGLKPKLSQFRRHFSARHLAALEKTCEVPAFLTKNHNIGRMISGEIRQVQSSPNLQKLSNFDLLHKVPFCANNRSSTASINQATQQSASNAPRALSYMVSIRHRLSNASSIFKYREESRAARIGIIVVAMLMLSYLPYGLLILLQGRFTFIPNASLCSILVLLIGNIVSPFVFAYRNRRIRRGVCRLFGVDPKSNNYLQKQRAQLRQNNSANAKHVRIHRNLSASNFSLNMLPYKFATHPMLQIQGDHMHGHQVQPQSRQGSVLVPIDDVETENSQTDLSAEKTMDANNNRLNNNNGSISIESSDSTSTNPNDATTKMAKEKLSLLQRICSNGTRKASISGDFVKDDEKHCSIEIKDDAI